MAKIPISTKCCETAVPSKQELYNKSVITLYIHQHTYADCQFSYMWWMVYKKIPLFKCLFSKCQLYVNAVMSVRAYLPPILICSDNHSNHPIAFSLLSPKCAQICKLIWNLLVSSCFSLSASAVHTAKRRWQISKYPLSTSPPPLR